MAGGISYLVRGECSNDVKRVGIGPTQASSIGRKISKKEKGILEKTGDHIFVEQPLVSLVSVKGRNLTQMVEIGETVETGENVEITSIHAVFVYVVEKMAG